MKRIEDCGDYARIELTKSQWAEIDKEDVPIVAQFAWHAIPRSDGAGYYAVSGNGKAIVYMHRLILGAERGAFVDHRDGNGVNNRRSNLRFATNAENLQNRRAANTNSATGIRGVYVHRNVKNYPKPPKSGRVIYERYNAYYNVNGIRVSKIFPLTAQGLRDAKQWLRERRGRLKKSKNEVGIRGLSIQRSKRERMTKPPRKEVVLSYNARYMLNGKSYTKNFPYTPEGMEAAKTWVQQSRRQSMPFSMD